MEALLSRKSYPLIQPPFGVQPMASKWVYTTKYYHDSSVDRYKVCLIAKGFTQIYSKNYFDTFSLGACLN